MSCVCLSQRHISKQANFHHLQRSDFFGHCSQYVATGEGRNIGQPLNLQLGFHTQPPLNHIRRVQPLYYCRSCSNPPVSLLLPSSLTHEQNPWTGGPTSKPIVGTPRFSLGRKPTQCKLEGRTDRIISSAKSRDEIPRPAKPPALFHKT